MLRSEYYFDNSRHDEYDMAVLEELARESETTRKLLKQFREDYLEQESIQAGQEQYILMKSQTELQEEVGRLSKELLESQKQLEVQKIINESLIDIIQKVRQVLNLNYSYNQNIEQAKVLLSMLSSLKESQN